MQKPIAESMAKQIALFLAVIYALGVVIVNFHLAQYDVAGQLGLWQPIYLFAGLYGILPISLGFAFCCLLAGAVKRGHRWAKAAAVLVLFALMWWLAKAGLNGFDFYIAKDFALKWDKWMWIHLCLALILGGAAYFLSGRWKSSEKVNLGALSWMVVPGMLLCLVYGYAFSIRFYNRIPVSWGGTRSFYAEFILDPNDKALRAEMERAGVKFYPGTARTLGTKLIFQTESDFICAVKQVRAGKTSVNPFLLKRDMIKAVKYGSYGY